MNIRARCLLAGGIPQSMKSEKPILMCPEMVRATLKGLKRQTRRVMRLQTHACLTGDCPHVKQSECDEAILQEFPYGKIGDQLWVKETHFRQKWLGEAARIQYAADNVVRIKMNPPVFESAAAKSRHWIPSIFMPRFASRINLKITGRRYQTIQDITEADAQAEGIPCSDNLYQLDCKMPGNSVRGGVYGSAYRAFQDLWNSINLKPKPVYEKAANGRKRIVRYLSYPWSEDDFECAYPDVRRAGHYRGLPIAIYPNPYVWVIEFERL